MRTAVRIAKSNLFAERNFNSAISRQMTASLLSIDCHYLFKHYRQISHGLLVVVKSNLFRFKRILHARTQ